MQKSPCIHDDCHACRRIHASMMTVMHAEGIHAPRMIVMHAEGVHASMMIVMHAEESMHPG